jgi:hypothetical protein
MKSLLIIAALLVSLLTRAAFSAELTPEKIRAYLAACEKETKKAIEGCQARIDWRPIGIANLRKDASKTHDSRTLKQNVARIEQEAKDAKQEIADLKAGRIKPQPSLAMPPKLGDIGVLKTKEATVVRVIDTNRMMVDLRYPGPTVRVKDPEPFSPSRGNLVESRFGTSGPGGIGPSYTSHETTLKRLVMIRGVSTSGIADDTEVKLGDLYEVAGTYKHGRQSTVMVLEPFDMAAVQAYRRDNERAEKAKSAASP